MMRIGVSATPDGFQADGVPLQMLIRQAFGVSEDRILGEPDWTRSARFDINAKVAPEDAPKLKGLSMQQRFAMLLPMLQDRFGLKFHRETKDLQVYTLVVAKGGPKLKESALAASEDSLPPPPVPPGASGAPGGAGSMGRPGGPRTMMSMSPQGMKLDARGASTASLSQLISQQISAHGRRQDRTDRQIRFHALVYARQFYDQRADDAAPGRRDARRCAIAGAGGAVALHGCTGTTWIEVGGSERTSGCGGDRPDNAANGELRYKERGKSLRPPRSPALRYRPPKPPRRAGPLSSPQTSRRKNGPPTLVRNPRASA